MTLRVIESLRNAACDAVVDGIDTGSGGGTVEFYPGSPPTNITDAPGETLLASVNLQEPAFGAASGGSAQANGTPITTTADNDGTIGWARVLDEDGNPLWDEDDVGTSSSNAITVNTTEVNAGVDFELTSYTFSANDDT